MSLNSEKYTLKITMTGPLLGSQPGRDTPASDYLREKVRKENPDANIEDEVNTLPEELQKGTTGFHKDEQGKPSLFNYQVKGMIKEAGSVLNGLNDTKGLKSKLDNLVFISPRFIPIQTTKDITICERPLRAETPKGPRTTLARSEQIQEGAVIECQIEILQTTKTEINEDMLRTLLDYGSKKGLGQWRNSGLYGQFEYELAKA
jgi:hypothetical protein